MDALEEQLLRALAADGPMTAEDLAHRIHARQWVDLSTALANLAQTVRHHMSRDVTLYVAAILVVATLLLRRVPRDEQRREAGLKSPRRLPASYAWRPSPDRLAG